MYLMNEQEYHKFCDENYNFVYKMGLFYSDNDVELARDGAQHAFFQLHVKLEKKEPVENYRAFLTRSILNYVITVRKKRGRELPYEDIVGIAEKIYLLESVEEQYITDYEELEMKRTVEYYLEALKAKNPMWHEIAIRVFMEKRSQVEVAKSLGMTEPAMYATIRRIKKWSKKFLESYEATTKERC